MELRVKNVFKLSNDYNEVFINKGFKVNSKYHQIQLSSRTINKVQHDDIYILEPHCYYYITFYEEFYDTVVLFEYISDLAEAGLIYNYDETQQRLYVYNCNENMVYLQQKVNILNKD